jgi:hypothetical protein
MNALILSYPNDFHAAAVEWVCRTHLGADVETLFISDFPDQLKLSIRDCNDGTKDAAFNGKPIEAKSVWRRRVPRVSDSVSTHPDDIRFVTRENQLFIDSVLATLLPDAIWINTDAGARRANNKALQLVVASQCGFVTPDTLISNDPNEIRSFLRRGKDRIYKPFHTGVWRSPEGKVRTSLTTLLDDTNLPSNDQLSACAGIYQSRVSKKFELRVTIFGRTCFAFRINSQKSSDTAMDWRMGFYNQLDLEPIELPTTVKEMCFDLLDRLELVFGAIDLAVTENDEFVFFEVNESGQFLWCEHDLLPL